MLTLKVELCDDTGKDTENLSNAISKLVTEAIRIKLDTVEFVQKGTIAEDCKMDRARG